MDRLKLAIPETGLENSDDVEVIPVAFDAVGAVFHIAEMFTEAELVTDLGVVFPIVAAVIGQWVSLGAGYAAAREAIAEDNMASGFSRGVVLGADHRPPTILKDSFWKFWPDPNPFDQDAAVIAQKAYNQGLIAGYMQGRELSEKQRALLWRDIGRHVGDQSYRGPSADWTDAQWVDWYITAAAALRRYHFK